MLERGQRLWLAQVWLLGCQRRGSGTPEAQGVSFLGRSARYADGSPVQAGASCGANSARKAGPAPALVLPRGLGHACPAGRVLRDLGHLGCLMAFAWTFYEHARSDARRVFRMWVISGLAHVGVGQKRGAESEAGAHGVCCCAPAPCLTNARSKRLRAQDICGRIHMPVFRGARDVWNALLALQLSMWAVLPHERACHCGHGKNFTFSEQANLLSLTLPWHIWSCAREEGVFLRHLSPWLRHATVRISLCEQQTFISTPPSLQLLCTSLKLGQLPGKIQVTLLKGGVITRK